MPVTFSATSRNSFSELKVTAASYRAKHCLTPGMLRHHGFMEPVEKMQRQCGRKINRTQRCIGGNSPGWAQSFDPQQ